MEMDPETAHSFVVFILVSVTLGLVMISLSEVLKILRRIEAKIDAHGERPARDEARQ